MLPQSQPRRRRNSGKVNLLISLTFHTLIVLALVYFAAREGLLGKQLKKIAVEIVREKPPEKPKEPEPPKPEVPKPEVPVPEPPKVAVAPAPAVVKPAAQLPAATAPPAVAPPAAQLPSFVFEGGKAVDTTSDPVQLYKGFVEFALRSRWDRPQDIEDAQFVAEVEITVDGAGRLGVAEWKRGSGDARWDASVRAAIAATPQVNRAPPPRFPSRFLVRFDVQEEVEPVLP